MLTAHPMKLLSALTVLALAGFLLAVFTTQPGCASNCGANCPSPTAYIGSSDDYQLDVAFDVYGPACPSRSSVVCIGDQGNTTCTHTTVTGQAQSWCDVLVAFNPYTDGRPSQIVHLEFGPPYSAPGTCCEGFPVVGPTTFIIPDHPAQGGVYATTDGGTRFYDAITFVTDGGADSAGDAARDAGTDAPQGG